MESSAVSPSFIYEKRERRAEKIKGMSARTNERKRKETKDVRWRRHRPSQRSSNEGGESWNDNDEKRAKMA